MNSIAVATEGDGGTSGLLVNGEIRGQGGTAIPFDSGKNWKVSARPPAGPDWTKPFFNETGWRNVEALGLHKDSPAVGYT
jgi:hypothetical protein